MTQSLTLSRLFHSRGYEFLMFSICVLYALTALPRLEMSELFKNLIIVGSLPALFTKVGRKEGNNTIFWVFLLSFVVQIVSWLNSLMVIPEWATASPQIKTLSALFLFVFIAFWMNGNKNRTLVLYGALILSFIATACYHNYLHHSFAAGWAGKRVSFGMHNAQYTSMLSVVVAGLAIYIAAEIPKSRWRPLAYLITAAIVLFSLFTLGISQSRQVWLAVVVTALLAPLICYRSINYRHALVIYLLLGAVGTALYQVNFVKQRIFKESSVIEKVVTGDWDHIPMTSVGIRVNSWIEASHWIARSPILGSDRPSVKLVLHTAEKFQTRRLKGFGHLHNYYIETLVAYGVVGILFLVIFYRTVIRNVMQNQAYSQHIFLLLFLIYWAVINCFESYNTKDLGLYAHNIVLAGLFVYLLPKRLAPLATERSAKTKEHSSE